MALYRRYCKIICLGPNHVYLDGFIAFPQVFGCRKVDYPMAPSYFFDFPDTVIGSSHEAHRRQRRQLGPAFTEASIREQEIIIMSDMDLLIEKLAEQESLSKPVNIVQWLNFTVLDIIGDLTYAQSFHSLENSSYDAWITKIFKGVGLA